MEVLYFSKKLEQGHGFRAILREVWLRSWRPDRNVIQQDFRIGNLMAIKEKGRCASRLPQFSGVKHLILLSLPSFFSFINKAKSL